MSIFAILFFLLQFPLGFLIIRFVDSDNRLKKEEIFFAILILGPASSCFLLLLLLLTLGSWHFAIFYLWALLAIAFLFSIYKTPPSTLKLKKSTKSYFSSFTTLSSWIMLVLFLLYSGILFGGFLLNDEGFPSIISLGWGDTSYHLSMVGRLRASDPFVLENPIVAGTSLNYPFMINLLTALYQRTGFSLFTSWHLSNAIYGVSSFFLIYLFGKRFLSHRLLANIFVAIVLFGGGIGFFLYFSDLSIAWSNGGIDQLIKSIYNPPHTYTQIQNRNGADPTEFGLFHNIHWIVPAISFLSHQRSFLPGIALSTLAMIGATSYLGRKQIWKWAIILGMIPLFHMHSFIALCIVLSCWLFLDIRNYRAWLIGGLVGSIIAIPQILYLAPSDFTDEFSFFKPWLGWMMCTHHNSWYKCDAGVSGTDTNILWFWTKNFGVVFWCWAFVILIYCLHKIDIIKKRFGDLYVILIPSIVLFVIPNLLLLQPWEFDNNKILYYWWIMGSLSIILSIKAIIDNRKLAIVLFTLFVILSTSSGAIDTLSRIVNTKTNHYGYYDSKDVKIAEWVNQNTIPNAWFLTGDFADQYIPMLTGRPIYLGYPGWLWTQGKSKLSNLRRRNAYDYLKTGNPEIMCREGVGYVVWDRRLLNTYPDSNKENVLRNANVVYTSDGNDVLEIICKR